ncbi:hypothetical protein E2562_004916 [Oryza meyeriana var. granulata]|uniref:USP domain-containing protein n=1 Tax=Oryza meyeriana var. granulata TaxID=110450 RepID=A0A6G1C437_9ORYZ|nr:hypothetical protein E2562_004916 [Oryza meyeriana var. granulata]
MPTEEEYILARIEFLVVVVTMLFLVIFIMDIFRGHFHNAFMRAILGVIDAASDSIVVYVMGAMQAAPFNNQMFPVWALVLVGFRHSIDFISGYGIPDHKGRRYREWRMVVKSYYRLQTRYLAFNSVWHGKSSELVSEYMRSDEFCANFQPKNCDPETMQGLEDVELHQEIIPITRKLVMLRIIKEEPKRAFGIMELEMAFVNDYFNTRYPMIFWRGFTSLSCTLILSVATFAVALWLAVDIRRAYVIKCEVHDAQICEVTHKENILDANLKAAYDRQTADDLKMEYIVANSLSRYCAYLLISKPDLLPDSFLVPKIAFRETVQDARHILKGCDSLKERYKRLMAVAAQDNSNSDYNRNVVQKGAKLAKELLDNESEKSCWEILAGVWVDLLVHIAPSWNVEAHKKCLESGGELITHIWALLWHCGIEKSMLWPVQDVQEKKAPEATQNSNVEKNNVQLVEPVGQAAGAQEGDNKPPVQATTAPDGGRRSLNSDLANGQGNMVRKMQNLGNTCYFNAVLQSLLALDELRFMMLEQDPPPGGVLHLELKRLFQDTSAANYAEG